MTRIFIDTDDAENYEDIESELEAYNIDFTNGFLLRHAAVR